MAFMLKLWRGTDDISIYNYAGRISGRLLIFDVPTLDDYLILYKKIFCIVCLSSMELDDITFLGCGGNAFIDFAVTSST